MDYTEPHILLYSAETSALYVMDDFGNAVQVSGELYYLGE